MPKRRTCISCGDLADRGGLFCTRCREITQGGLQKRIFLFTPDAEIAREVKEQFSPRGCKVHWEPKLDEIESMMKKDTPDLVVLDVEVAGTVGFEYAKEIKSGEIPIFLVIVAGNAASKQLFTNIGVDAFFVKPMDKVEFMTTVAKLLTVET
jgi:DNA-binding response OmpR family regulator